MTTIDAEETIPLAKKFMDQAKADGKPFFIWLNPTRGHVYVRLSDKWRYASEDFTSEYDTAGSGVIEHDADVVGGVRTRRVAGQLQHLPRGQVAEDLRGTQPQLVLQGADFGLDIDRRAGACAAQLLDLCLQISDGLLEVEVVRIHRKPS